MADGHESNVTESDAMDGIDQKLSQEYEACTSKVPCYRASGTQIYSRRQKKSLMTETVAVNITGYMLWCHLEQFQIKVVLRTLCYEILKREFAGRVNKWWFTMILEFISSESIVLF